MGLEKKVSAGAHNDDIISALRGHIKDNQEFNPGSPLSEGDPGYNSSPSLKDKVHCLVSVLPADKISLIDDAVIKKMRKIREEASDMGIPQVVVMTMVDRACPVAAKDLRKIYTSLKIKEKMEECHIRLGVPMNCIFPLKNYHEEGSTVLELDCLILATLTQIIHLANDYLSTIFENVERVNFKPTAEMAKLVANIKPTVKMVTQMASIRPTVEMEKPLTKIRRTTQTIKPMATVEMREPICLIESDESGYMCVMREALEILEQITQPVVVVAIVGLYRTGKSFLMNRLAGKNNGFALGATIESKTKGIWMWCLPHPTKEGHTLVLLDTEGLGDVDKGDEKHDTWIFCLAVLLSSTLVYNSMGTIDNDALQKLHYVTELTEHIKVKSGLRDDDDQSTEFMSFFPSFVWAVRDFTLKLELEGRPITAGQYLENALKLKPGSSIKSEKYNLPRRCLREFFSPRKCFVFERPASKEKMSKMEQLTDVDLESSFLKEVEEFCSYIFTNAQAKTMRDGLGLIGRMLGTLAETYVEAINSGRVPCLDNAVESLSQIQNKRAVTEALEFYKSEMSRNVQLPTETQEELSEIHTDIQREAIEIFINGSFNDINQRYQIDLMRTLQGVYEEYCRDNVETSRTKSKSVISRVFSSLETELRKGSYMRPGGYTDYHNTLKRATEQYRSEKGHGLMREEVLKEYLSEKEGTGQSILAADKCLTESQQEIERERLKSEAREQQQRALEEQNRIKDQQIKDQQRAYDENIKQMLEKFKRQEEIAKQEHERVLNAKLKEQRDLLEQGFKDRAEKMQGEIDNLEEKKKNWSWKSITGTALDTIGTAAMIFLPGAGKIAGFGLSALSKLFK